MKNEIAIEQLVADMSERIAAITLGETKNHIIPRFNQPKTIACLNAEFRVHDDIPSELKQGIFSKPISYPAKLRFANATNWDDSKKDVRGLSIRLSNVEGSVLWGELGLQDFVLNSYPALFVATPEDFLDFISARQRGKVGMLLFFLNPLNPHLKSLLTVLKSRKHHLSPFDVRYWSTVPYRLGELGNQVVKYSVIPCSDYKTSEAVNVGENQLRGAIKAHLQQSPAYFHFAVQLQTSTETMPIEDASVIWDEQVSPFQTVATIKIENQDFDNPESLSNCERSRFNPWQCLAAHEPLGRMNQVRRLVYANAAQFRNKLQNKE
jgi:catalase